MKLNRKVVVTGVVVGAFAAGAGGVLAATGPNGTAPRIGSALCQHDGMRGTGLGQTSVIAGAATYLNLTQTELQTQLQAGKSLADIATAQGMSVSGLEDAIIATMRTNLAANTNLTAAQRTAILAQARTRLETMVNQTHPYGAGLGSGNQHGRMAGSTMGMWR